MKHLLVALLALVPVQALGFTQEDIDKASIDAAEIGCLADNVYYEAGDQTALGMEAVADVVYNRVDAGFARTFCGVIYQASYVRMNEVDALRVCQFTWTCDPPKKGNPNTEARYRAARQIAHDVYYGVLPDRVKGALFYHNTYVLPSWAKGLEKVGKIGDHIFYRPWKAGVKVSYKY